jgi:hypothetical protein
VRNRTTYEDDFTRTWNTEVRDILAASAQKSIVFLAKNGSSNPLPRHA